ncbi:receptor-type tyrosine-protein phosphatase delta-like [Elysia marginata]|uniref:protein-tyrosine-phosphatase n=1 Tax=Elysia marginata TaxID=1093978 RepID=A0AAV4IZC3_9GAST|nr:receptor-type tyrosine-protein phosphatase delta-like [Elysia marginata]
MQVILALVAVKVVVVEVVLVTVVVVVIVVVVVLKVLVVVLIKLVVVAVVVVIVAVSIVIVLVVVAAAPVVAVLFVLILHVKTVMKKCSMYWPEDGEKEFGDIAVRLVTTHVFAEYTIRHMRLFKNGEPFRYLTQFHFTAWPDESEPESPWGLIDLHHRVMAVQGSGPTLVHCSAGVGRTGTFIGLCNLLQEAEATGKMDFRATLWKLRQDRMHSIQTAEQYVYLHHVALVGHMVAGTTVKLKDLSYRLFSLESVKEGNKSTHNYKQEFEALVEVCDATTSKARVNESLEEGQESCVYKNIKDVATMSKDRLGNILPNPSYRPDLIADNLHQNTYINAVLVPNLIRDRQDILTQLPLPNTVTDFWRLVSQKNVGMVVAFDTEAENTDETIGEFLPKSVTEPFENDSFIVESQSAVDSGSVTEISLTVQQKKMPGVDSSVGKAFDK